MSARVSLSRQDGEALLRLAVRYALDGLYMDETQAADRLRSALAPRPKRVAATKARKATKAAKRAAHSDETAEIREAVFERAGGYCEACGAKFSPVDPPEMDHFFPRRHGQSVESCWLIHGRSCHRRKTDNAPSAAWWLVRFRNHCLVHMYEAEAMRAQARLDAIEAIQAAAAVTGGRNV